MKPEEEGFIQTETLPRFLEALSSLNKIGANINSIGSGDHPQIGDTLCLIVESATKVIPGASSVIYIYDPFMHAFDLASRVFAGDWMAPIPGIEPRADGLGARAIEQHRRVISYEEPDLAIHPLISAAGAKISACYPLVVAEQPVGVLYVYLREARQLSQLEQLMLDNFVNQAAIAIYQAQKLVSVQRDLERKNEELKRLRRAGLLISSRLRLEDTLEAILQMALDVTNAQYGIYRLLDRSGQNLITRAVAGEQLPRPLVEALPLSANSIMGWVARNRKPVCIPDLRLKPWSDIYYPLDGDREMRSELAVPLVSASGRLEGVLNLESQRVNAFTEQDSHLLQSLATQAVIAIQEVRLLDVLQEVAQLLLTQTCQQMLSRLAELACDLLNTQACAIWTMEDGQLSLQSFSISDETMSQFNFMESLPVQAISTRSLVADSTSFVPGNDAVIYPVQALVVPLIISESSEPLGAFGVYSKSQTAGHFIDSDWDKKVLTCLAYYAALAVRNAAHQEALHTAQQQRAVAETFAVVGDIAANLLHQLNNKVGTIPVRIQGIQDKCQPALVADPYLAANLLEIENSANEAMEAVRDNLLHLRPIHLAEVGVSACVNAALETANLPEDIQVKLQELDTLPTVMAGQRSLILVFTNLVENAADAMKGKGIIVVRGAARGGWVEVTVTDNGPGIPAEFHDRIFELNYSGRYTTRSGKLGFGLWWVKTLMARLGGQVTVESDGKNSTTFHLKLPAAGVKS